MTGLEEIGYDLRVLMLSSFIRLPSVWQRLYSISFSSVGGVSQRLPTWSLPLQFRKALVRPLLTAFCFRLSPGIAGGSFVACFPKRLSEALSLWAQKIQNLLHHQDKPFPTQDSLTFSFSGRCRQTHLPSQPLGSPSPVAHKHLTSPSDLHHVSLP